MSLDTQILGHPNADNALLTTVDSGHSTARLLFDCGENCLSDQRISTVQAIDHLCFSHFHMDHVCGFDTFFRHNYNRPDVPVHVWGPPGTIEVMGNRFRSFTWNLHADQPGEWIVHEVHANGTRNASFFTREAFASAHELPEIPSKNHSLLSTRNYRLEAKLLPHKTIKSVAYRLVESDRRNVSPEALQKSELLPGPWLQDLTDESKYDNEMIEVEGKTCSLGQLREDLLSTRPGSSLAYLTDFRVEPGTSEWNDLVNWVAGTETLISECQYHSRDEFLAQQHGHMTANAVGQLANEAKVGQLILQHLSRRYRGAEWTELLQEAKAKFAGAQFPSHWPKFD